MAEMWHGEMLRAMCGAVNSISMQAQAFGCKTVCQQCLSMESWTRVGAINGSTSELASLPPFKLEPSEESGVGMKSSLSLPTARQLRCCDEYSSMLGSLGVQE